MDYERVRGWTKSSRLPAGKSSLFDLRKLFIPINQGNVHWVLVVVDIEDPDGEGKSDGSDRGGGGGGGSKVSFYDSFDKDGTSYVEVRLGPTRAMKHRQMFHFFAGSCIILPGKQTTAAATTHVGFGYAAPLFRGPKTRSSFGIEAFFSLFLAKKHGSTYLQAKIMTPPRCASLNNVSHPYASQHHVSIHMQAKPIAPSMPKPKP